MELIYPENAARLHIPIRLDGSFGQVVLHAAHRDPGAVIDWDLDGAYIGRTADDHRLQVSPGPGPHRLTLTDQHGRTLSARFQCVRGSNDRPNE